MRNKKATVLASVSVIACFAIYIVGDGLLTAVSLRTRIGDALLSLPKGELTTPLVLFAFTILGIFSRDILAAVNSAPASKLQPTRVLTQILWSKPFYRSLIVSPIAFILIYLVTKTQPSIDSVVTLVLAYQNGFFWKTVTE